MGEATWAAEEATGKNCGAVNANKSVERKAAPIAFVRLEI